MFGFLGKLKSLFDKKNDKSSDTSKENVSEIKNDTPQKDNVSIPSEAKQKHPEIRVIKIPLERDEPSQDTGESKGKGNIQPDEGLPLPPRERAGVANIPSGNRPPIFDFLDTLFSQVASAEEPTIKTSLDGSANLNKAIEDDIEEPYNEDKYPELLIYGGHNGTFDMIEMGKRKQVRIEGRSFPVPLDTDIVQINAYHIANQGNWIDVSSIGNMTLNAQLVTLTNCYSLKKLPPLKTVATLVMRNCPQFQTFHPTSQVAHVNLENCGIRFLPKSLKDADIVIQNCPYLRYIHPAIPTGHFETLHPDVVNKLKLNYFFSESVPDDEKKLYPIPAREIILDDGQLKTIPECFYRTPIIVHHCPHLKYIHPAIDPSKVQGIEPKTVCRYQMNYLFEKVAIDNDAVFNKWFPIVKTRMRE